ncbi:hypothetical protein KIW84_MT0025 (mitochondrion) [Lathyrus oleraceus]|nr:hypothetical protein KIW84_MT0025 [Pisum sativum]
MNLSRWKKGIAMDSYEAFRNKKIQSDDEFIRGPRKSKFNRSEHRPVKAEAAGSSPVSPDLGSDESINSSL